MSEQLSEQLDAVDVGGAQLIFFFFFCLPPLLGLRTSLPSRRLSFELNCTVQAPSLALYSRSIAKAYVTEQTSCKTAIPPRMNSKGRVTSELRGEGVIDNW